MENHIRKTLEYFQAHIPVIGIEDSLAERIRTIEKLTIEVAEPLGLEAFTWDLSRGLRAKKGKDFEQRELNDFLRYLDTETPKGLFIFLNADLDRVGIQAVTNTTWKVNGVAHPETMMKSSLEQSTLCIGR